MTEVPKIVPGVLAKIVSDRLRTALPNQAHPDADLLTAFAEQTLAATERDGILDHLALCGNCREVIALALPPTEIPAATEADRVALIAIKAKKNWLTSVSDWFAAPALGGRGLRWAALAAGVVVAASVLLLHPGKPDQAKLPPSANRPAATIAQALPTGHVAPQSSPSAPSAPSPVDAVSAKTKTAKTDEASTRSEVQLSKTLSAEHHATQLDAGQKTGQIVAPPHEADSAALLADNHADKKESGLADKLSANPSADGTLMARNDAPANPLIKDGSNDNLAIEKAKPAPQGTEAAVNERQKDAAAAPASATLQARTAGTSAPTSSAGIKQAPAADQPSDERSVTWKIAAGVLQRSEDSGQSWQDALPSSHLLCYASRDHDIWAGGKAGTLLHSANNGIAWVQVRPSTSGQPLNSDITHIEVRGPAEIIVSTSNNEIWSTSDGGKTWERK